MADHIKLRKTNGVWSVRAGGAVLGESRSAIELTEGDLAPVMYFPREDIAMVFLDASPKRSQCSHKGEAEYYSIVTPGGTMKDAVWSYPSPAPDLNAISGHLAFALDQVTVEQI